MASKGEGSRGGKVIRHTASGQPVYDSSMRRIGRSANVAANLGATMGTLANIGAAVVVPAGMRGKGLEIIARNWTKTSAAAAGAGAIVGGGLAALTGGELKGEKLTQNWFNSAVVGVGLMKFAGSAKITKQSAKLSPTEFREKLGVIKKSVDRNLNTIGRGIRKEGNVIHADFGSRNPFKKGK